MPRVFSAQDLELLGYVETTEDRALSAQDRPWKVFSARAIAGIRPVTHTFAYLQSACGRKDAEALARMVKVTDDFFLITTKSGLQKDALQSIFGKTVQVAVHEDLIWQRIETLFSDYVKALKENIITEKYYVTPRSEETTGPSDRLDETIISYLAGRGNVGCINVVSASAGVGKTTLARYVVKRLAELAPKYRVIPTYVEASHWGKLQLDSVDELWDIISNSLRTFSPGLSISEGLFKHALKQGYLVFVFDGYDELCGQRYSQFNAREVLQWLIEIAKETDARIVITTRTLFWDAEVGDIPESTVLQRLRPFEAPQARDYFHKFFPGNKPSADKALGLYTQLIKQSQRPREAGGGRVQFANLPLCVGMVARYVREGGTTLSLVGGGTVIEQFLLQILEREHVRQKLKTSAREQLSAFEEVAVSEVAEGAGEFDLELLAAAGFAEVDIGKLNVHPLLTTTDNKTYRFSYAFLESYLLASHLAKAISRVDAKAR